MELRLGEVLGPVVDADVKGSCEYWPEVKKHEILTYCCKLEDGDNSSLLEGRFFSYIPLITC